MNNMETLKALKEAIDNAIYTYGNTLVSELEETGTTKQLLEDWLEKSVEISNRLDEFLNA